MSMDSNPGAATPYSLYKLYNKQAAATANPFTLRQTGQGFKFTSVVAARPQSAPAAPSNASTAPLLASIAAGGLGRSIIVNNGGSQRRSDSPPRASFKLLAAPKSQFQQQGLTLSLTSLR